MNAAGGRRRESFDEVAELYEKARPSYPQALVRELVERAGIVAGARVLEIGCGTGQLTLPLAETGAQVVAVELGPNLVARARAALAAFPNVSVELADFDQWEPDEPFDVVVAATAFHWLNPTTRLDRCARALRRGGTLAIIDTHWGVGATVDPFAVESQACYARWDPHHAPSFSPKTLAELSGENQELSSSRGWGHCERQRFSIERRYSAEQYCELLQTFSDVRGFGEPNRSRFVDCIANLIHVRFGGSLQRTDTYELSTVRAASPESR